MDMIYNQVMEFSDWLTRKYVEWRGAAIGNERTITEFAEMIGVSQPVMSGWMKRGGRVPRSQETVGKLVRAFGYEVYEILGLPHPEPHVEEYAKLTESLSPQERAELQNRIRRWLKEIGAG
jgi:hypothetical protein